MSDHLQGIIVTKGTIHDAVNRDKINAKLQEQVFEHRLDLKQINSQFNLAPVFVLAAFGAASFPALFFDFGLLGRLVCFVFHHLLHHDRIRFALVDTDQRQTEK